MEFHVYSITHDFNTTYYIADDVVVLNYSRVVEIRKIEEVIRNPYHLYTKLLISSIPIAIGQ